MEITAKGGTGSPLSRLLDRWYPCFWILVAVFLLYGKTLAFQLTNVDDAKLIGYAQAFHANLHSVGGILFERMHPDFGGFYRPLLTFSFIGNTFAGGGVIWYHAGNLVLHGLACCLLFALFIRVGISRGAAFFWSLLFAVHPLLVQAVAWIPGRNDSLLAVFVLGSFLGLLDYGETRRAFSFILHLGLALCALLTKETAAVIFPVFAAALPLMRRPFTEKERAVLIAGWGAAMVAFGCLWMNAVSHGQLDPNPLLAYVSWTPGALLAYLGKTFFPVSLSVFPYAHDLPIAAGAVAAVLLAAALLWAKDKRKDIALFGALWAVLFSLPPTLINWDGRYFEHRMYLPLIGLFLVFAGVRLPLGRKVLAAAGGAAIIVFGTISFLHCDAFMNRMTFWENAVATSPHYATTYDNLGLICITTREFDRARRCFDRAISLDPASEKLFYDRCCLFAVIGDFDAAQSDLSAALRLKPSYAPAVKMRKALARWDLKDRNAPRPAVTFVLQ